MHIDTAVTPNDLDQPLKRFFEMAGQTIDALNRAWNPTQGAPVFTVAGKYTTRGWTEWTQGFQFGCQLLQFDATWKENYLAMGRRNTLNHMATHLSATGVHDHGFNNVSTYGTLRRLARENRTVETSDAIQLYEHALRVSGAVQAARWSRIADGTGFVHSFNGPHSLFSDTIRSMRSLILAHQMGHVLMGEGDRPVCLLGRTCEHIYNTLRFNVFYGDGRDIYDEPGRVAHEGLFNMTDGAYRCPSTQQGYSAFSTWTRGLAWILLGCAEQLECFRDLGLDDTIPHGQGERLIPWMEKAARATADFYLAHTTRDGIPVWDTGAPGVAAMGDYTKQNAEPDNPHEPLDSSAAAIVAQGLLRLGHYLGLKGKGKGKPYYQAGLTVARTLLSPPFVSADPNHQGLLLHAVYHRPNGWDHIPKGAKVPHGEACMWGDYHLMELAVYLKREAEGGEYLTFYR